MSDIIYSRQEDLERLMTALGMSLHARPISPAEVFDLCLEEIAMLLSFAIKF
jgi:hypothetical protein